MNLCLLRSRMQQNIKVSLKLFFTFYRIFVKVALLFSLVFLLNPCHGKYLLVKTEDSSELVPGNKGEADAGPLEEDTDDDGKNEDLSLENSLPDVRDSRGPFHRASANRQRIGQIIERKNKGLPCVFRCHGNVTTSFPF